MDLRKSTTRFCVVERGRKKHAMSEKYALLMACHTSTNPYPFRLSVQNMLLSPSYNKGTNCSTEETNMAAVDSLGGGGGGGGTSYSGRGQFNSLTGPLRFSCSTLYNYRHVIECDNDRY